ncbi:MAG: LysR family transcriptional regulator substrate-binding protein [Bacilli bacterium]
MGILARKDSPLAKRKYIRKNDLLKIPLIVSKQIARRQFAKAKINKWFGMEIDKLNIVATYNLIYNAGIMVQEGMGCALAIGGLANTEKNSPLCFIPLSPRLESELNIIWKKNGILSKPAEIFLSNLQKISPAKKSSILVR